MSIIYKPNGDIYNIGSRVYISPWSSGHGGGHIHQHYLP